MGRNKNKAKSAATVAAEAAKAGVRAAVAGGDKKPAAKAAAAKAVAKVEARAERRDPLVPQQRDPYHVKTAAMPSQKDAMAHLKGSLERASQSDIPTAVAALDARYNPEAESTLIGCPGDDGTYTYTFNCETRLAVTWASDTVYLYAVAQWMPTLWGHVITNTSTTFAAYGAPGMQTTAAAMNANLQSSILTYKPVSGGMEVIDFDALTAVQGEIFTGWTQVCFMPPSWTLGDPCQYTVNILGGFQTDMDWSSLSDSTTRNMCIPWKGGSALVEGRDWWPKGCNGANDYVYNNMGDVPTIVLRRPLGSPFANVSIRSWLTVQCHIAVGGNVLLNSGAPCTQLRPDATLMDRIEYVLLEAAGYEGGHMTLPMLDSVKKALRGMMKGINSAKGLSVWKKGVLGVAGAIGGLFGDLSAHQLSQHYAQQAEAPEAFTDLELCILAYCPYRGNTRLLKALPEGSIRRAFNKRIELVREREERLLVKRRAAERERLSQPRHEYDGARDPAAMEQFVQLFQQLVSSCGRDGAAGLDQRPTSAVEDGFAVVGTGEPESPEDTGLESPEQAAAAPGPLKPRALVPRSVATPAARPGGLGTK